MKKFILPLILCLLASASCKKEDTYIDPILKEVEYTEYIPQAGLTFMIPFGYKSVTKAGTFFKGYRYRVITGASIGPTTLGTPIYSISGKKYFQEITVPDSPKNILILLHHTRAYKNLQITTNLSLSSLCRVLPQANLRHYNNHP